MGKFNLKENIKAPSYYIFVRGIHIGGLLAGDSPDKWAVMWKLVLSWCYHVLSDVVILNQVYIL